MRTSQSSPQSVVNSSMVMTEEISPEDAAAIELDNEIALLQEQISSLKDQRRLQTATILSSQASKSILSNLRKSSSKTVSLKSPAPTDSNPLLATSAAQTTHNLENLYRACAHQLHHFKFKIRIQTLWIMDMFWAFALMLEMLANSFGLTISC
ncbi:hypothetical protein DID88_007565 [Monilinia fructigena]|uniref:Uncharacterized protein n=1 Tax=Monilinia fructigena TaxID=38457 RepID=A0A395J2T1_9HELO|nr:hypothetical protein DID88_007565 [Monilinia fructigena]